MSIFQFHYLLEIQKEFLYPPRVLVPPLVYLQQMDLRVTPYCTENGFESPEKCTLQGSSVHKKLSYTQVY